LSTKTSDVDINQFIENYVRTKEGQITKQSNKVFKISYSNAVEQIFTYEPAIAREKKIPLIAMGSKTFQQILKECLENGVLCQVSLKPKENYEILLRNYFKDKSFDCKDCIQIAEKGTINNVCTNPVPCYHKINNAKITSIKIGKQEAVKYYIFYYSVTFHNKLRSKNNETIIILLDETKNVISAEFDSDNILRNRMICVKDCSTKLKPAVFDELKTAADQKLQTLLNKKIALFDLPLNKERKARLDNFKMRLRRERREQVVSKKQDFDIVKWQSDYEVLLKKEEESFMTNVTVKLSNLFVVNTSKVKFEINLDNEASIKSSFVLGIDHDWKISCQVCKKLVNEGYATQDSLYVCSNCTRQSIDTGKIYSKKANLMIDKNLYEYMERDAGFICSVCGRRHSQLLEFKCSHDNSSICIYHYGLCDVCGKVFSKLNLKYTHEFTHQLCPQHITDEQLRER